MQELYMGGTPNVARSRRAVENKPERRETGVCRSYSSNTVQL